jgi:exosortase
MNRLLEPKNDRGWRHAVSVTAGLILLVLVWSYWTTFVELNEEWLKNPLYSHGYLVPLFAVFLLWWRQDRMPLAPLQPSWWTVLFLIVGGAMRLGAAYFYFSWPERCSLLFMIIASVLAIGGWAAFRWTWPSILFLVFMLPLPGFVENGLMRPLQRVATLASTNVLQTLGFFAQADGNKIVLSNGELGIVEACSGLGMLSIFVALTVAACLVVSRPLWQKLVIVASSIPIAIVVNVIRISATGILYDVVEDHEKVHDWAGWLMPLLALVLLLVELKLLDFIYQMEPIGRNSGTSRASPVLS